MPIRVGVGTSSVKISLPGGGSICKHSVWISERTSPWEHPNPCRRFARVTRSQHGYRVSAKRMCISEVSVLKATRYKSTLRANAAKTRAIKKAHQSPLQKEVCGTRNGTGTEKARLREVMHTGG